MLDLILNDATILCDKLNLEPLRDRKILLTGANGLIGLNILALLNKIKDNLNIQLFCSSLSRIETYTQQLFNDCHIFTTDLTNLSIDIKKETFDYIIHCAGYGQPQKFTNNKLKTIQLNTQTIIELFSLLEPNGSFLYCSSSEIYSGLENNVDESRIGTTTTDHQRACYIEGKRCGEAICHIFKELNPQQNIKIARISTVYGPGTKLNDSRVLNSLIQKAITNNYISMLDAGKAIRTFCYSADAIEMLINILLYGKHTTYNITGIDTLSIKDLAINIAEQTNTKVFYPYTNNSIDGNPQIVLPSIDRYLSEFGNKNFTSISDGLNTTISWYKNLISYSKSL